MKAMMDIFSLLSLCIVCGFLVLWCRYDDGLIGKIGLVAACLGCGLALVTWLDHGGFYLPPSISMALAGMAIFMLRHVYRRTPRFTRKGPMRRRGDRS